jgi:hypothetical protein
VKILDTTKANCYYKNSTNRSKVCVETQREQGKARQKRVAAYHQSNDSFLLLQKRGIQKEKNFKFHFHITVLAVGKKFAFSSFARNSSPSV